MDLWAIGVAVAGLCAGVGMLTALIVSVRRDAKRDAERRWRRLADQTGMTFGVDTKGAPHLVGEDQGFGVIVDEVYRSKQGSFLRVRLAGNGRISATLDLRREAPLAGIVKRFEGEDVQLDDAAFDKLVHVEGPEDQVLAALGVRARTLLRTWVDAGGTVERGNLFFNSLDRPGEPQRIRELTQYAVALAQSLEVSSVPVALLENASKDPNSRVRRRNLEVLVTRYPGSAEAREALHAALDDSVAETRIWAAQALVGEEAARVALSEVVEDLVQTDGVRAQALDRLVEGHPYEAVAVTVARALASDPLTPAPLLRCAAIRAVAMARDASQLERLAAQCAAPMRLPAEVGEALANALGVFEESEAEKALLGLLAHESAKVKVAAAAALAKVGTVRAVEWLLPLTQGVLAGAVGDAAREAVRAIQARLGDADAGRLSVVDARVGGGLSVPPLPNGTKDRGD
ncbi:MAG: hypothetical protein QM765_09555 [Myxococcales bacterium]